MSRATFLLMAVLIYALGCGEREITLRFHTPSMCCPPEILEPDCEEDPCPLADLHSVQTIVERVDLTVALDNCRDLNFSACNYEDLSSFVFSDPLEPIDGAEIILHGFSRSGCAGDRLFRCDTFGDHVIDLNEESLEVPLWCTCPSGGE